MKKPSSQKATIAVFALALLASFLLASCNSKKVCPICGAEVDHLTNCDVCGSACCEYCADPDVLYDYFVDEIRSSGGFVFYDWWDLQNFIAGCEEEVIETVRDCYDKETIIEAFYDIFVEYTESQGYVIPEAGD